MKQSLWDKIKWHLFGETRIITWLWGIILLIYGLITWAVIHFVIKYW